VNEILKQRLVGALILLALGVIFWPIIFVEPDERETGQVGDMPPPPRVSRSPVEAPDPVGLRASKPIAAHAQAHEEIPPLPLPAPGSQPEAVPAADEAEPEPEPLTEPDPDPPPAVPRSEAPEPLHLDTDGVPIAWILQVASVSSADKAEALRRDLLAMDNKAYVEQVPRDGRTLYRVYIGPKFERAKLESLQGDVDAKFGVQSMVRRYVP